MQRSRRLSEKTIKSDPRPDPHLLQSIDENEPLQNLLHAFRPEHLPRHAAISCRLRHESRRVGNNTVSAGGSGMAIGSRTPTSSSLFTGHSRASRTQSQLPLEQQQHQHQQSQLQMPFQMRNVESGGSISSKSTATSASRSSSSTDISGYATRLCSLEQRQRQEREQDQHYKSPRKHRSGAAASCTRQTQQQHCAWRKGRQKGSCKAHPQEHGYPHALQHHARVSIRARSTRHRHQRATHMSKSITTQLTRHHRKAATHMSESITLQSTRHLPRAAATHMSQSITQQSTRHLPLAAATHMNTNITLQSTRLRSRAATTHVSKNIRAGAAGWLPTWARTAVYKASGTHSVCYPHEQERQMAVYKAACAPAIIMKEWRAKKIWCTQTSTPDPGTFEKVSRYTSQSIVLLCKIKYCIFLVGSDICTTHLFHERPPICIARV